VKLFNVYENGALRKVDKIDFADHKVFLIDDAKTIYLWFGRDSSQNKRNLSEKRARKIIDKRIKKTQLEVLHQGKEYGRFLTMIETLRKGILSSAHLQRRNELKLKIDDTLELLEAGIEPDFEAEITLNAHKLSEKKKSYEDLCLILAKLQLELISPENKIEMKEIEEKATEIHQSSSTYDELCWLIAELQLLKLKKNHK
jgi:hypothetical protein